MIMKTDNLIPIWSSRFIQCYSMYILVRYTKSITNSPIKYHPGLSVGNFCLRGGRGVARIFYNNNKFVCGNRLMAVGGALE